MLNLLRFSFFALAALTTVYAFPAFAVDGFPHSWQLGLNEGVTPIKAEIDALHGQILWIITAIVIFVTALIAWVIVRYNKKSNPEPKKFTHNVLVEVIWTVVPVVILIIIGVPSYKLLKFENHMPEPEMTIKATGYQWYWGYDYPDNDEIAFLSYMIPEEDIDEEAGEKRLLETDNKVVLPIDTNIQILITAADVLHSFAVPSLGIKQDAVPGRLNETWVNIKKPGTYYGQCSEICGTGHAYMPIQIEAVSKEDFAVWLEDAKAEFGAMSIEDKNFALSGE